MKLTGLILRPCSGQAPGVSLLLERNSSEAVPPFCAFLRRRIKKPLRASIRA